MIAVRHSPVSGRALFASVDIAAGTVLFSESPLVAIARTDATSEPRDEVAALVCKCLEWRKMRSTNVGSGSELREEFGDLDNWCMDPVRAFESLMDNCAQFTDADTAEADSIYEQVCGRVMSRQDLFSLYGKVRCNSFAIRVRRKATATSASPVTEDQYVRIGLGVFLKASLANHSCDPNALVSFEEDGGGTTIILKLVTTKSIKRGDEIFISYGPTSTRHSASERQRELRRHWFFNCLCSACSSVSTDGGASLIRAVKCANSMCPRPVDLLDKRCGSCSTLLDSRNMLEILHKSSNLLDFADSEKDSTRAIKLLKEALVIRNQVCYPLSHLRAEILDRIAFRTAQCGEFTTAVEYCHDSVRIVRAVFGSRSVEYSRECFKLCTIMWSALVAVSPPSRSCRGAKQLIVELENAINLYETLNIDREDLEELRQMKSYLL